MAKDMDGYIRLAEVPDHVPGHPSYVTVWTWCRYGLKARNGEIVRLKHVRIGHRLYTRLEWLDEFFEALAAADVAHYRVQHPNRNREVVPLPPSHYEADAALREAGM